MTPHMMAGAAALAGFFVGRKTGFFSRAIPPRAVVVAPTAPAQAPAVTDAATGQTVIAGDRVAVPEVAR